MLLTNLDNYPTNLNRYEVKLKSTFIEGQISNTSSSFRKHFDFLSCHQILIDLVNAKLFLKSNGKIKYFPPSLIEIDIVNTDIIVTFKYFRVHTTDSENVKYRIESKEFWFLVSSPQNFNPTDKTDILDYVKANLEYHLKNWDSPKIYTSFPGWFDNNCHGIADKEQFKDKAKEIIENTIDFNGIKDISTDDIFIIYNQFGKFYDYNYTSFKNWIKQF